MEKRRFYKVSRWRLVGDEKELFDTVSVSEDMYELLMERAVCFSRAYVGIEDYIQECEKLRQNTVTLGDLVFHWSED